MDNIKHNCDSSEYFHIDKQFDEEFPPISKGFSHRLAIFDDTRKPIKQFIHKALEEQEQMIFYIVIYIREKMELVL